tara:strand:- start:516 stop:842 length:327 start_codon:yes stop_codon:yes gene_type:complete
MAMTNDLKKHGPFGKYSGLHVVTNGTVYFTGSALGAAAVMVSGSTFAGSITAAGGGTLGTKTLALSGQFTESVGFPAAPGNVVSPLFELGIYSATSAADTEHIVVFSR